jgi:Baseplate J-like protein
VRESPLYRLTLRRVAHLDPFFDTAAFSFLEETFIQTAPGQTGDVVAAAPPPPAINYLARDYSGLRQLLLDRLSLLVPHWAEPSPADLSVTLVEALAYAADQLGYYQDAVATEAYLGTSRRRVSTRRHARLLNYRVQEGCNARVWVTFDVATAGWLAKDTQLVTGPWQPGAHQSDPRMDRAAFLRAIAQGAQVFATMDDAWLAPERNRFDVYTWGAQVFSLRAGAMGATLRDPDPECEPVLAVGDVLVLEQVRSSRGGEEPDPLHRHPVRLTSVRRDEDPVGGLLANPPAHDRSVPILVLGWDAADALPFELPVADFVDGEWVDRMTIAVGNVVLANHGRHVPDDDDCEPLPPVPSEGRYWPTLRERGLTFSVAYDGAAARSAPAAAAIVQDPAQAVPDVCLDADGVSWTPRLDLLGSTWATRAFVVEMDNDRTAFLRFGDDVYGAKPPPGSQFCARYRIGNGIAGNVGARTLALYTPRSSSNLVVRALTNPLAATGGTDPQMLEAVRLEAPQAFNTQERCVTIDDFATVASRHPEVQQARASRQWTGSWSTVFLAVLRTQNRPVDDAFVDRIRSFMQPYLLIGTDLAVVPPRFVALDIALTVGLQSGYLQGTVSNMLLQAFSDARWPSGERGFFHPDNVAFGQSVYLSQVVARARQVPGVGDVTTTRFSRWHEPGATSLERGVISIGPTEIARVDNNPDAPEFGQLALTFGSAA